MNTEASSTRKQKLVRNALCNDGTRTEKTMGKLAHVGSFLGPQFPLPPPLEKALGLCLPEGRMGK